MSKELRKIPTTCPIYDKIEKEVGYIKDKLGEHVYSLIESEIESIRGYSDEIRDIAGDLRDTCSDIAEEKNKEIEELEREIQGLKDNN